MLKNKLYRYGAANGGVPAHTHFGKELFDNMVKNKTITAIVNADTDESISYEELAQMTADIARSLNRIGVEKGDVICCCSEKNFEYLPTVMGVLCAGAVFSPLDPTYGSFNLLHRLKICRPKFIFCSLYAYKTHKATFQEAGSIKHYILYGDEANDGAILFKEFLTETTRLEEFQPVPVNGWEDLAIINYSSGTTGPSKGVPLKHVAVLLNSQTMTREEYKGAAIYNSREFYYSYGLMFALACLRVGSTIVYNRSYGEKAMLEAIQKYKVKIIQTAPVVVTELIKSPILDNYDVSSLEYIMCSSTYCREEAVKAIKQRLPNLVSLIQLYGMAEGGCICNELGCPKGSKPGSSGMPCYGFVIKVVDLMTRKPLGPNLRGEICIKGPSVMEAYLNNVNPDCKDDEGFLKTGDIGYYDEDGYFYIVSRIKELIKFNGQSIAPAEFEALLLQHPSVREAAVVGISHPKHEEVPVAFVVLQPGCNASKEELVKHMDGKGNFMRYAGGVYFIDRLPRGYGDKLNRKELEQRLLLNK